MKRNLLYAFLFLAIPSALVAQCDPQAHDWGSATFGVSPDPTLGENFAPATINVAYSDAVYVLCPSTVGDIDPTNAFAGLGIDSISLDSITIFNGLADVQLSNIGLNVTCNNNGESPNPCMFYPSHAYCGDIMGVPTVSGTFDVQIWVTAHATFFNSPLAVPYSFPGYTLVIAGPTAVIEESNYSLNLLQNTPNPANAATTIRFELSHAEDISFDVINLLGEVVYSKNLKGKKGENQIRLETSTMETGIYLYSIQSGDKKLTKRMIVQR